VASPCGSAGAAILHCRGVACGGQWWHVSCLDKSYSAIRHRGDLLYLRPIHQGDRMQTSFLLLLLLAPLFAGCSHHVTFAATRGRPEAEGRHRVWQNGHAAPAGEDLQGHLAVWGWQHGIL
jgi:hypothetical protein